MFKMLRCFVMVLVTTAVCTAAEPVVVHVAPDGASDGDGSAKKPVGTVTAARDIIRERRSEGEAGPFVIELRGGRYFLDDPIKLESADSGSADAPLVIRPRKGESPRLIGGKAVTFSPVTDEAVLNRVPEAARKMLVQANLKKQGVTAFGKLRPAGFGGSDLHILELFVDGEPMQLAKWPNEGWMTITDLPDGKDGDRVVLSSDRHTRWADASDAWLYGYWYHGWADQFLPIANIDQKAGQIRLGVKHGYGLRKNQRILAINLLEELDTPGEWYLERETGVLYFYPPRPHDQIEAIVSVLDQPLVQIAGASHVQLEGLTIEIGRGTGVTVHDGESVTIAGCTVRNFAARGIVVRNGKHHRVVACNVHHTGSDGINVSGGNRKTLTPAGHEVVNNDVHHFGRLCRTYRPGLRLNGVGIRAAHNLLHHAPHMAIGFAGNDHLIELNEVHHVLTETDDSGAFYIGRDWTARGHVVRHNYLHHCGSPYASRALGDLPAGVVDKPRHSHGTVLLYLDDTAAGVELVGNVLEGAYRAVLVGGGRDNLVANNLVIGGEIGIHVDARGVGWASKYIGPGAEWRMYKKLERANYKQPPYSERYPKLATMLDDNPHAPIGTEVVRNILIGVPKPFAWHSGAEKFVKVEKNLNDLDIPITGPAELMEQIPAEQMKQIGFEPIPLDQIGLKADAWRESPTRSK